MTKKEALMTIAEAFYAKPRSRTASQKELTRWGICWAIEELRAEASSRDYREMVRMVRDDVREYNNMLDDKSRFSRKHERTYFAFCRSRANQILRADYCVSLARKVEIDED